LSWEDSRYQDDNMGRHFIDNTDLTNGILVLDIDGCKTKITNNQMYIEDLDITVPLGLYTVTTQPNKYHVYYRGDVSDIANRLKGLHNTTIDIFTHGTVFEGHTFSPDNQLIEGDILPIPANLAESIYEYQLEKNLSTSKALNTLGLTSNIQRYNLVKSFIADTLDTQKQWNMFFKMVIPLEYQDKKRTKKIDNYELSYDLFNKLCVKLTTTSELDFNQHTMPAIRKLLQMWNIDPDSPQSQQQLNNILPSLPQHESEFNYQIENDVKTFQEHLDHQKGTDSPVFYTFKGSRLYYIEIDKFSHVPKQNGDSYLLEEKAMAKMHPERNIENEEGRVIGWDSNVPLVYLINNPYKPQYELDFKTERHTINLYQPTEYVEQATANSELRADNLIYKTIYSTIGPIWYDLYMAYAAQIVFGSSSPTMVMWMSALKTELGGSGKSVVTLELFSLILGSAAAAVDHKTVSSGWGDIVSATKVLSLEDMPELNKEWETVYSNIKQQNTNSYRKLNMKGSSIVSERVSIAITGSTNHRLKLSPSDRRFLCLEPAHFHGLTEPLNEQDQIKLSQILGSHEYNDEVQAFVDHLLYLHKEGFDEEIQRALFIQAPETEFRHKWIGGGESNTLNMLHSMSRPRDLLDNIKLGSKDDITAETIAELFEDICRAYQPVNNKSAVSWKWFEEMLPLVQSDKYSEQTYSKASISKMLHIDFKNVGTYAKSWDDRNWPASGYTFTLLESAYEEYLEIIKELKGI